MKALSIRQPWATLILSHGKRVENRTWNTSFRGEVLIHASKGMTRDEYEIGVDALADIDASARLPLATNLPRGGIIARARIVGVIEPTGLWEGVDQRWHDPSQFGFVLEDVRTVSFVPCTGALGFFAVHDAIVRQALGSP